MNASNRYDIYALIHKGLRAFMTHTLVRVGRLDALDADDVSEVTAEVRALMAICRSHLHHENEVVHPAIEARAPGRTTRVADEHVHHEATIDALLALLPRLPGDPAAATRLYRQLAAFVAENLEHMQVEETEHNAALWATHRDEEIVALEHRIVASLTPEESQVTMRWMLPCMTPTERGAMLAAMKAQAPAEAFDGVIQALRPLLGGRDWAKLAGALNLPANPWPVRT